MNKTEFIEKLKQDIPTSFNEVETAKYIYIQLGKEKAFDEKYFFGNNKTRKQIYKMAEETEKNTDKVVRNKKIICVSLSYLYRDILKEFGIDSIIAVEGNHKYPIIVLKNGMMLKADLQLDLYNIQTQSKTKYFGTKMKYEIYRLENLNDNYSLEIDKKIGYVEKEEDYRDNAIESIKEKVKGKNANEALETILIDEELNRFERNLGSVERCKYYNAVLTKTVSKYMNKKIFAFNCYREIEEGQKDYTMCMYSMEKDDIKVYLFSNKENKFAKVELQKLDELIEQGLVLGIRGKEQGVRKLEKIIVETKKNNEKMFEKY